MTTYYVGPGGNDANTGLSWAQRKLTLNGAEDVPVVAGDTVYVGPGTYRELLTVDVSGAAGQIISFIGDYDGSHTDGVGGVVRITGSDDDQTATRATCITATTKTYRTFTNFVLDTCTGTMLALPTGCTDITLNNCLFQFPANNATIINVTGAAQARLTVSNCAFFGSSTGTILYFSHTSTVDAAGHVISNCIFLKHGSVVLDDRIGGITVKNSLLIGQTNRGVRVSSALTAGQKMTVNNCILVSQNVALHATTVDEFDEDYNCIYSSGTARMNVNVGANSLAYPPNLDTRWFFQLVNAAAANQVISAFDLASYSQLINVAGTAPTATDMRGTAAIGGVREWGALEYDTTLNIEGGAAAVSGGNPFRSPFG